MIIKTLLEPLALVGKYPTEPIVSLLGPHVLLHHALSQTSDDTTFTKSSGHAQQHIPLFHSSKEKAHQTVHALHTLTTRYMIKASTALARQDPKDESKSDPEPIGFHEQC
ncbi:hypothetical protein G6F43_003783 [Rhizopus delemar]|nr:hypothetical protein G6F43_003783 [Rhizopus delemar]